jgi:L-alanine-DL-glutamate epimerase-like enolase superfamily enzyme
MTSPEFAIRKVQAFSYRYPLSTPVVTSFGRMLDRPAVFVRVEDDDGYVGWGEVWANFPAPGAEYRTRLVNEILAPMIDGAAAKSPAEIFERLTQRTAVLALQCAEPGPFAQAIAGIDIALWDLYGKRQSAPLWRMLGGEQPDIRVYASGINPSGSKAMAEAALGRGHRALKLKIGFGAATDRANLTALRALIGSGFLATDSNQAWSVEQALANVPMLEEFDLAWLEEPIRADCPWEQWQALRKAARVPLAAGENVAGQAAFAQVIADDVLSFVQPDVAKWGGITGCIDVARKIRAVGKTYCPHYLGGGIGLLASAHLLGGAGGEGLLEIDANDNPLRDDFCGPVATVTDGRITLTELPGLGIDPDFAPVAAYRTL